MKTYKILFLFLILVLITLRYNRRTEYNNYYSIIFGLQKYKIKPDYKLFLDKNYIKDNNFKKIKFENKINKHIFRSWCKNKAEGECGGRKAQLYPLESSVKNSGWKQTIYGDYEIENFIKNEFGENNILLKAYNLINPKYGAARADFFRYLVIYRYGGLYLDMKSCVTDKIPDIPNDKHLWISHWGYFLSFLNPQSYLFKNGEFQQWYIYGKKGSPILRDIINLVVNNIFELHNNVNSYQNNFYDIRSGCSKPKHLVLCTTGPIAMTNAIQKSKNKASIYYDNRINNFLKYMCSYKFLLTSKNHYSKQTENLIFPNKNYIIIPKIIYIICENKKLINLDNIKNKTKNFNIKIYDYTDCIKFLNKYYGKDSVDLFTKLKFHNHKIQFFKFCILYIFGGYYLNNYLNNIDKIDNSNINRQYYSLLDSNNFINDKILVTQENNPIIYDMIEFIYNNPNPSTENYYTIYFNKKIKNKINSKISKGANLQNNNWDLFLL